MTTLLFDIDGTLMWAKGAGRESFKRALEQTFRLDYEKILENTSFLGATDLGVLNSISHDFAIKMNEVQIDSFFNKMASLLEEALADPKEPPELILGADGFLRSLKEKGDVRLGVITGNSRKTAEIKLNAFNLFQYFEFGAYGSENECRNELARIALSRANHPQGDPIYLIGDTPNDVKAALHIGAIPICIRTGHFSDAQLKKHGAQIIWDDFSQPVTCFDQMGLKY